MNDNQDNSSRRYPARSDAGFPAEYHVADDEISLYDLWDVLMRRLPVLIGVTALVILGGLAYALSQPVQYEYRSGLELPRVYVNYGQEGGGLESVVSPESVIARLEDVIIPRVRAEHFGDSESGPRVQVIERGGDHSLVLQSTATRDRAERVSELHESIANALAEEHESRYERWLSANVRPHENRAGMLDEQLGLLEGQLESLSDRLDGAGDVNSLVVTQQMNDLRREILEVRRHRVDARSAIEAIEATSHGTELSFLAGESENPAGPGRSLIVALSVVLGGMLGLFTAFFWEFVSNARQRRRTTAT